MVLYNIQFKKSIFHENVMRIRHLLYIIKAAITSVRNYRVALLFKHNNIINHSATKECAAIFQRGLIDTVFGAFRLDSLHDTLNRTLTEIAGITLHDKMTNTFNSKLFLIGFVYATGLIIPSSLKTALAI